MTRILFSDLDGTLLEHRTYSHRRSTRACAQLEKAGVIVCFVSSKTQAEIEHFCRLLDNRHPYICENGGAIIIPSSHRRKVRVIRLGASREKLTVFLRSLAAIHGIHAKGFCDMTVREVARTCALPLALARLAKQRRFDEPFVLPDDQRKRFKEIQKLARRKGFSCTRGSRFYHILGKTDKGRAARILARLFRRQFGKIKIYSVGDSLNDAPMLQIADRAFLVEGPKGGHDADVLKKVRGLQCVKGRGPAGFSQAARMILEE